MNNSVVVLSGGVGGARFLEGLIQIVPQENVVVIGNTGDDEEFYGLHVSPDLDIVLYTLAGVVNQAQGWGFQNETYQTMEQLTKLGNDNWFQLGDKDLATHIHRTNLLKKGKTLSEVTAELCEQFNLKIKLIPMTDQKVRTKIKTHNGLISFQEYFVKNRTQDDVVDIIYEGVEKAEPALEVLETLLNAQAILLAPSNPLVSIGTILALTRVRKTLKKTKAKIAAVSPIIQGKTVKGPANRMMKSMGLEPSALGVAKAYQEFLDVLIIDEQDKQLQKDIEQLGLKVITTNTLMKDKKTKAALAKITLESVL